MTALFELAGMPTDRSQVSDWLKKDDDPAYKPMNDRIFATFLNGFIIDRRGRKEGELPVAEKQLTNNIIFRKLKIALDLKNEDILEILDSMDFRLSKHELSAFFRNPKQDQFRECKDQVLRNFLTGMQNKYHKN
jgi:uncharacterized protein YehS (DUF1456 family)